MMASGFSGGAARCREVGPEGYVTKAVSQSDLRDAVLCVIGLNHRNENPTLVSGRSLTTEKHLHILLAEDNLVNQKLAERLLEKQAHHVTTTANGREALERLQKERFDLVFMDIQMPEMDGFKATAAIRDREKLNAKHIPIIAMTAHAMRGDQEPVFAGWNGRVRLQAD